MSLTRPQSFHEAYRNILAHCMNNGYTEENMRTLTKIKAIEGGAAFKIDLRDGRLPIAGNRKYFPHVAAAETAWQLLGTRDPEFILKHAPKLWSKFVEFEEDYDQTGHPSGGKDILKTAYGWRWREAFGRDQLAMAVKALDTDPTNRQIFVQAWDPRSDGLGAPNQPKNIPCPLGFTLSCQDEWVHMSVFVRSSDLFVGLPYDVMAYALTLDAVAAQLGKIPATITFTLAHPHLYQPHFDMVRACTNSEFSNSATIRAANLKGGSTNWPSVNVNLPAWSIEDIEANPDGYVAAVKRLAGRATQTSWNPMPDVIE